MVDRPYPVSDGVRTFDPPFHFVGILPPFVGYFRPVDPYLSRFSIDQFNKMSFDPLAALQSVQAQLETINRRLGAMTDR